MRANSMISAISCGLQPAQQVCLCAYNAIMDIRMSSDDLAYMLTKNIFIKKPAIAPNLLCHIIRLHLMSPPHNIEKWKSALIMVEPFYVSITAGSNRFHCSGISVTNECLRWWRFSQNGRRNRLRRLRSLHMWILIEKCMWAWRRELLIAVRRLLPHRHQNRWWDKDCPSFGISGRTRMGHLHDLDLENMSVIQDKLRKIETASVRSQKFERFMLGEHLSALASELRDNCPFMVWSGNWIGAGECGRLAGTRETQVFKPSWLCKLVQ